MASVFSAISSFSPEHSSPVLELQLLPDDELLNLWEQTQKAVWTMEDNGWDANPAQCYGQIVIWEMQRRVTSSRPGAPLFGEDAALPPDSAVLPHIMTVPLA